MNAKNILSLFTDLVKIPRHKAKMKKQRKENPHLHVGKDLNVFKDTKIGKRCFIVGNGPSLTIDDLNMIAGEDSFASNGIFGLFDKTVWRPTYYFLGDPHYANSIGEKIRIPIENSKNTFFIFTHLSLYPLACREYDNVYFYLQPVNTIYSSIYEKYFLNGSPRYSKDMSKNGYSAGTITYEMLEMALYMGYSEIYLLGIDHTYKFEAHAKGIDGDPKQKPDNLLRWEKGYKNISNESQRRHIMIQNCTRGGMLEIFNRNTLEQVLSK